MKKLFYLGVLSFLMNCKNNNVNQQEQFQDKTILSKKQIEYNSIYPYSETKYIEVITYPNRNIWDGKKVKPGVFQTNQNIIFENKLNFNESMISSRQKLNKKQSEKLFQLLQNYECSEEMAASCFDPRDLIVFYNKKDMPFEYIEICFGCSNFYCGPKYPKFSFCISKAKLLYNLLEEFGLKHKDYSKIEVELLKEMGK